MRFPRPALFHNRYKRYQAIKSAMQLAHAAQDTARYVTITFMTLERRMLESVTREAR